MMSGKQNRFYVFGITLIATLGGLLFGYDTAVISGAVDPIKDFFQINQANYGDLANFYHGATVSSALIGCIIGSAFSGLLASNLGRRNSLMLAALLFLISALGSAYPEAFLFTEATPKATLLVSFNIFRIIGGLGVGIASAICPMYIAEIAPSNIRGKLVSWNQFAIIFGMLVVYFVNFFIAYGKDAAWINTIGWRYMFGSESFVAAFFGLMLFFVPETPRYLVLSNQEEKALDILSKINGLERAKQVLTEIKDTVVEKKEKLLSYGWKVLVIGVLLSVFQQFVGINVVLYYAPTIFKSLGFGTDAALWQTVIMGFVNIIFTLIAIFTVDKFGRKPLLIIGSTGMAIGMFAIALLAYFEAIGVGTLIFIIIYSASFMMSWGPICWVLISEIFPNTIRGKAVAIAVAAQWISNFIVSSTFPALASFSVPFTYAIYGAMSVLSALFVWKLVPETKGKTLEDMSKIWKK